MPLYGASFFSLNPFAMVARSIYAFCFFLLHSLVVSAQQKPNIIYIYADDLGYGELGCYGQEKIRTPNLDRLAASGMKFTQHYTGAPVCAPARSILMTGKHSGHSYIRGNYELGQHDDANEGGQMPLQRRLPKRGFKSASLKYNAEITLSDLEVLGAAEVDLLALKQAGLVAQIAKVVKVIKTGEISRAVKLNGIGATAAAKSAIEAAGGSIA